MSSRPTTSIVAHSDDKDTQMGPPIVTGADVLNSVQVRIQSESSLGKRLFFADSDDEDSKGFSSESFDIGMTIPVDEDLSDVNDEADVYEMKPPSTSSAFSNASSVPTSPRSSPAPFVEIAVNPKRPRLSSPEHGSKATFTAAYIGTLIVGNAWSTVKGKGYVKPGDGIRIERDEVTSQKSAKTSTFKNGSNTKKDGSSKKKTVQLSIATMMKATPPKVNRKSVDSVVRLTNMRGFEFGRLPQDVSVWMSKLLDMGLVEFRGCSMIECPDVLHSGADLIVSLSVYLRAAAFKNPNPSNEEPSNKFNEGQETVNEQYLRERKNSLLCLFHAIGLRPHSGERSQSLGGESPDTIRAPEKRERTVRTEIVGDGEQIEVEDGEELTESELDVIYKRAQANDRTMGEMEPAQTFTLKLRGYQKQALLWMHSLETGTETARRPTSMHPLWNEYLFPAEPHDGLIDLTEDDRPFYFNPYSGELSLDFPKAERKCRGGILADVGMGKTIMLSALIQTNCKPDIPDETLNRNRDFRQLKLDNNFRSVRRPVRPTKGPSANLIVAPTSLLSQWSAEITGSSKPGSTKVIVWHGQNRLDLAAAIEDDHDDDDSIKVVITSYGVLVSEHAKSERSTNSSSPIFEIEWLRVVCDEAHNCKSRTSKTARAVYELRARNKWAVTGTPIVNKLEDLFSLLKFIGFKPWSDYSFFRSFITLPFLVHDPKAIEIVQVILESVLLRREKNMLDTNGKPIVELPRKEIVLEKLELSTLERRIYDSIYIDVKRRYDRLNAIGLVRKNYTHILAMLMRLRRAVLHPNLVLPRDEETSSSQDFIEIDAIIKKLSEVDNEQGTNNIFAKAVLNGLGDNNPTECPICLDVIEERMLIPECLHQCCKDCIISYLTVCSEKNEPGRCPTCLRTGLKETDLLEVMRPKVEEEYHHSKPTDNGRPPSSELTLRRNDFRSSTKLDALILHLRRLRAQDPCFRAVVFSQFTSFMDLIEVALKREHFDLYRFDGSMDVKKRNEAISEFKTPSRRSKVLIISLKAGGVGLNLTTANHVFMMDCWWNAAVENQAIDRVHRIGQEKTVYVTHFVTTNTIEGRILRIQKRKTAIIKEAFSGKGADGDVEPESLENLKIMFGDEDD